MRSHTELAAKEKGIELVTSFVAPSTTKRIAKDYSLVSSNEEKLDDSAGHGDDETSRIGSSLPLSTLIDDWSPSARESTDKARRLLYLSHTFEQFAEFWRILKPNGHFLATCPSRHSPWALGDPSHTRVLQQEMLMFLSQRQYAEQVGVTSMSDFRYLYKADFEPVGATEDDEKFVFILKAIKKES